MTENKRILKIERFIEGCLEGTPFELVLVEYKKAGTDMVLRIFIDHPDGVMLEHCTTVSHLVADAIEVEDPIGEDYQIEVSSPGVDRPLIKPSHFESRVGQRIQARLHKAQDGIKIFTGNLTACEENGIHIEHEQDGLTHFILYEVIAKATLKPVLKFN